MSNYCKLKVKIENSETFEFYFSYNDKTTFDDLLEFIAYYFPEKNICPCFKFKANYNNIANIEIERNWTFVSRINNCSDFILFSPNKKCNCIYLIKDNFSRSKLQILQNFANFFQMNLEPTYNNPRYRRKNFFDLFVNINSIKDIYKGWEIKMSSKAEREYDKLKQMKVIRIGAIGESNKGKSFVLSKISKMDFPIERTKGLCIKYPDNLDKFLNRKIVLLDLVGLETIALNKDDEDEDNKLDEKTRDKLYTEYFLENYMINNSDILLFVVGVMTYYEQKLLNKIKFLIKKLNTKKYYS